jgi:predicted TPR repeat methyltransferase
MRREVIDSLSSGDLIADRRFAWALASRQQGDITAALDLLHAALELTPNWAPAWFELGCCHEALHNTPQALEAFQKAINCDPDDSVGASLHYARLSGAPAPAQAPHAYVRALFDDYAPRFNDHLVQHLHYNVPALIRAALIEYAHRHDISLPLADVLDLGCGTGLVAQHLNGLYRGIDGVDISPQMIQRAAGLGLYRHLSVREGLDDLNQRPAQSYEAIIAADVFVYIGALDRYIEAAARLLQTKGLLIFSIQETMQHDYILGADLRYAHKASYIERLAARYYFHIQRLEPIDVRHDQGRPLAGRLIVLQKPNE